MCFLGQSCISQISTYLAWVKFSFEGLSPNITSYLTTRCVYVCIHVYMNLSTVARDQHWVIFPSISFLFFETELGAA